MGAPDLLQWFRRDGFALSLLPSGGLAVRPASKLTEAHRQALKDHKAAIVDLLDGPPTVSSEADELLDADRHCWPLTTAMNTVEIDVFTLRLHLFTLRGLDDTEAESLADGLVVRDREADDRGLCLECAHLRRDAGMWKCNQRQRAGQAVADVPGDLVKLLQRCDGFKEMTQ
jgi:hypothetical protein